VTDELIYLDSSAIVKLIVSEKETQTLRDFLRQWPLRVSSRLAETEVIRAVRRSAPDDATVLDRAREVLSGFHLLNLDVHILSLAADLTPHTLRSLDAIHGLKGFSPK